jgi:repressor LexA
MRLTARQDEVLSFVRERIRAGLPPTRIEIARHFKFNPNAAECHLRALQRHGFIRLVRGQRNIQVTAP